MPDDPLLPAVYDALRRLAEQRLAAERPGHTLQATALVHDAYLRLSAESPDRWTYAGHFYHAAAEAMRRVLVDHARAKLADKRGGGRRRVPLADAADVAALARDVDAADVIALDAAVSALAVANPAAAEVVRLRFYAGLSVDQAAAAAGLTPRAVDRKWAYARAWLRDRLTRT